MGLLDDAIREHLELKRRHGAPAAEVSELEREAFGPARQAPAPLAPNDVHAAQPAREPADPALIEPLTDPPDPDPGAFATRVLETEPAPYEPPAARLPEPEPEVTRPYEPPPPAAAEPASDEHDPEPAPEQPVTERHDTQPPPPEPPGGETRAFDAGAMGEAQDRPGHVEVPAEDVLEETPEFLQETPEHDRLWFEQRPPRDFDFDK